MTELVLTEWEEGVCTLTLNNSRKKNALSLALLAELAQAVEKLADNEELRAVILQGAKGTFSVGADLTDVTGTTADQEIDERISGVCQLMHKLPVPCLAAIEGHCVGGAVSIALGCDILVLSENAYFEIPAIRLGLLYNPDSMKQLHARLGSGILTRLLLLGERCNASTMLQTGMVGGVVPEGTAYEKALKLAKKVTYTSKALAATKSLIIALEQGQSDLSHWFDIRNKILGSAERRAALALVKEQLGIN